MASERAKKAMEEIVNIVEEELSVEIPKAGRETITSIINEAIAPAPTQSAEEWAEKYVRKNGSQIDDRTGIVQLTAHNLAALLTEYAESLRRNIPKSVSDFVLNELASYVPISVEPTCTQFALDIGEITAMVARYAESQKPPVPESAEDVILMPNVADALCKYVDGCKSGDLEQIGVTLPHLRRVLSSAITAYAAAQTERLRGIATEYYNKGYIQSVFGPWWVCRGCAKRATTIDGIQHSAGCLQLRSRAALESEE